MSSFVYVFSRFTPEALLIEALMISLICTGYTAFWVLHKRKKGVIEKEVPGPVVKNYLNQLILDAQELRSQLFGLLSAAGIQLDPQAMAHTGSVDVKMTALEAKILEQTRSMEAMLADKARIEKELATAKTQSTSASSSPAASGAGDPTVVTALQTKVSDLEGKLAEYSIIEDDLANLKRLQQENQQLRAALAAKGGDVAQATAPAPVPSPKNTTAAAETSPVAAATGDAQFEGLVDQVEKSIQEVPTAVPTTAVASPTTPDLVAAPTSTEAQAAEKTDADLVAEFEKMLNG